MTHDHYRELARVCARHKYRLCLVGDRKKSALELTKIQIKDREGELQIQVSLSEHPRLDSAADVALAALMRKGIA